MVAAGSEAFEAFAKEIQDRVKKQRALVGEDAVIWSLEVFA
jgi:hypothetical protein